MNSEKTLPLVSVIIPTYNCEAYINETIDSILNQTYDNIELIIVDDGSTDKTCQIVESYGDSIRLIRQKNARVCAARNRGINEAKGEYICLIDHDDFWYPNKIERQVDVFRDYPESGIVFTSFINWHANDQNVFPHPDTLNHDLYDGKIDAEFSGWIYHKLLTDCWILTSTAMIRKEVFDKCGRFDTELPYSEDWDLWLRVSRNYPITKLNIASTLYRQHNSQGNRIVRDIDYRTRLLTKAVKEWGMCSNDGRCLSARDFNKQLSLCHAEFAFGHLIEGSKVIAIKSLLKAWWADPMKPKCLMHLVAALCGWKPKW